MTPTPMNNLTTTDDLDYPRFQRGLFFGFAIVAPFWAAVLWLVAR